MTTVRLPARFTAEGLETMDGRKFVSRFPGVAGSIKIGDVIWIAARRPNIVNDGKNWTHFIYQHTVEAHPDFPNEPRHWFGYERRVVMEITNEI